MDNGDVERLIAQIVHDAKLASDPERDDLRRELECHFAAAHDSGEPASSAIERFGNARDVGHRLEEAHRTRPGFIRVVRVLLAFLTSAAIAVALDVAVNVRLEQRSGAIATRPAFVLSIAFSTFIIVALIAASELDIEPLCVRLERHPLRLALMLAGLLMSMILVHAAHNGALGWAPAFVASAVNIAIWTCTIGILARTDRAFTTVFTGRRQ